jgi:hypothetical protein
MNTTVWILEYRSPRCAPGSYVYSSREKLMEGLVALVSGFINLGEVTIKVESRMLDK